MNHDNPVMKQEIDTILCQLQAAEAYIYDLQEMLRIQNNVNQRLSEENRLMREELRANFSFVNGE